MRRGMFIATLGLAMAMTAPAIAQDLDAGLKSYQKRCAQCHGVDGGADGPAANYMLPRPRVFKNNPVYKFRTTPGGELPTDQDLFNIITRGIPGTSMPAFDGLSSDERWNLVEAIKSFNEEETAFNDEDMLETLVVCEELEIDSASAPAATEESIALGREVYLRAECNKCHGMNGRGNGPSWAELKDLWENPMLPADLSAPELFRGGRTAYDIFRTMSTGLSGTPMPAHRDDYTLDERWAVSHYVMSLGPEDRGQRDETVVAIQVDAVPESHDDEAWADIPQYRFMTTANVIVSPRKFWVSVPFVEAQAVYTNAEIVLRLQWNDRSRSTGRKCEGGVHKERDCGANDDCPDGTCQERGPGIDFEYPRVTTEILGGTLHPDQFLVQFPVRTDDPRKRPYFILGDSKQAVNLWWWRGDLNVIEEKNAKGTRNVTLQSERSQTVTGEVSWDDGRYTMIVRRSLISPDTKGDVQFDSGVFLPIAFQVWDGDRAEVGQRRSLTTWYWLYLRPPIEAAPAGLPGNHIDYVAPVTFVLSLVFLLLFFRLVRTRHEADAGDPEDTPPSTEAVDPATA